jgi:hypothetical protein
MDQAIAGLIGAAIGGSVGILTSLITSFTQRGLERQKAQLATQAALNQELRMRVSEVARSMLAAQHSMEWLCWHTHHATKLLESEVVSSYHAEIHAHFPELLGSLAAVAALDQRIYTALALLADMIFALDSKIASALAEFKTSPQKASEAVAQHYAEAVALYRSLPVDLAKIMRDAWGQKDVL